MARAGIPSHTAVADGNWHSFSPNRTASTSGRLAGASVTRSAVFPNATVWRGNWGWRGGWGWGWPGLGTGDLVGDAAVGDGNSVGDGGVQVAAWGPFWAWPPYYYDPWFDNSWLYTDTSPV